MKNAGRAVYIIGYKEPSEKWIKMEKIANACSDAGSSGFAVCISKLSKDINYLRFESSWD